MSIVSIDVRSGKNDDGAAGERLYFPFVKRNA
jgi:hypothetical protein